MRRRRERRGRRAGDGGESGERQSRSRSSSRENASGLCLSGVQTQPRVRHTMSHTRRHGSPVARALVCTNQHLMLDGCTSHILPHLAHGRIWAFEVTVGPAAKQNRTHGERIRRCVLETTVYIINRDFYVRHGKSIIFNFNPRRALFAALDAQRNSFRPIFPRTSTISPGKILSR